MLLPLITNDLGSMATVETLSDLIFVADQPRTHVFGAPYFLCGH